MNATRTILGDVLWRWRRGIAGACPNATPASGYVEPWFTRWRITAPVARSVYRVIHVITAVLVLVSANVAQGAVAVDAESDVSGGNVSSLSWSHTTSGNNRLLIVSVGMARIEPLSVSGITYGGTPLTLIGVSDNTCCTPGRPRVEMWKLVAPATGTNTVVVTLSGTNDSVIGAAVSYTGVNQTTPLGTFAAANNSDATPSVTVTSAAGELVQDAMAWD